MERTSRRDATAAAAASTVDWSPMDELVAAPEAGSAAVARTAAAALGRRLVHVGSFSASLCCLAPATAAGRTTPFNRKDLHFSDASHF